MTQRKEQNKAIWWKILIILTFIVSLACLFILIQNNLPEYEYETETIILENDNTIKYFDGEIVDYLCDEGVVANTMWIFKSRFYASTWEGTEEVEPEYKGMTGKCMIKIRREI